MTLDRAAWAAYEAANRRAADDYWHHRFDDPCNYCGQPRGNNRAYCSTTCKNDHWGEMLRAS